MYTGNPHYSKKPITVLYYFKVKKETEKAFLVEYLILQNDGRKLVQETWMPKAICTVYEEYDEINEEGIPVHSTSYIYSIQAWFLKTNNIDLDKLVQFDIE